MLASKSKIVNMNLTEALEQFPELKAEVDKIKNQVTEFKADVAKIKKEAEEAKKADEADDETDSEEVREKTKFEEKNARQKFLTHQKSLFKALKAAEEEQDLDKKNEKMAEAMKYYKAMDHFKGPEKGAAKKGEEGEEAEEGEEGEEGEDAKKKTAALEAEVTILRKEAARGRLQFLEASFKGRVDEKTMKEYKAQWNGMTIPQLDSEIKRIQPFVGSSVSKKHSEGEPLGFSTLQMPSEFSASEKDDYSAKVEEMPLSEVFD